MAQATVKRRLARGVCVDCGGEIEASRKSPHCKECRSVKSEYQYSRRQKNLSLHKCTTCATDLPDGWAWRLCETCKRKTNSADRDRYTRLKLEKMCIRCGKSPAVTFGASSRCEDCYFKDTAKKNSYRGRPMDWQDLKQIWYDQGGICPYTGIKLTLGKDTDIDHVYPSSRFKKDSDSNNLQWVFYRANRAKDDMTPAEFRGFINLLSERMKLQGSESNG